MQEFYRKSLLALIFLVAADALLAALLIQQSYLSLSLFPSRDLHWRYYTNTDTNMRGTSTVRVDKSTRERLRFDFNMTKVAQYPFVFAGIVLTDRHGKELQVDLTKYTTATFNARCAPANEMVLSVSTFDEKVSKPGDFITYRSPSTFFACNAAGVPVTLDLTRLTIAQWWFDAFKLDLTQQETKLNRVSKIAFGTSSRSAYNVDSHAEISDLVLHGRDYRYIEALVVVLLSSVGIFAILFFRAYTRALTASLDVKMKKDLPLVAYRQLTLEPYKDKEKATVLRFIATNYTNTELDLEGVVAGTGTNRNKVNEVLKTELGMTFTSYLNKLRLTEAARLLTENSAAAVAEIAYSVGYGNVSYFNKLFKEEYGCTPKTFRTLASHPDPSAECLAGAPSPVPSDEPG
jgi:AraC-like DNA-binding protein